MQKEKEKRKMSGIITVAIIVTCFGASLIWLYNGGFEYIKKFKK
jgi:hypothetical protein